MGRPTNLKLGIQMEYGDPHHRLTRWPQRSKIKVITSRQFDACLPITRQRKKSQTPKLAEGSSVLRVIFHSSSTVKRSRSPDHSGWPFKSPLAYLWWPLYRPHSLFGFYT